MTRTDPASTPESAPDGPAALGEAITPEMDRHNGRILIFSFVLIYLAAPVIYVGIVQAALLDQLGTGAALANLPASAYLVGAFAPLIAAGLLPQRLSRAAAVGAYLTTAVMLALVSLVLFLPAGHTVRIGAVIAHGLIQGFSGSIAQVFTLHCLGRGTSTAGRARAFKLTFALTPFVAVAGSLGAQFVLNTGIPGLVFPQDFGLLYLLGVPCLLGTAWMISRFQLAPVPEEPRRPLLPYLRQAVSGYLQVRPLVWLWLTYLLWYVAYSSLSNLSLYTREAMGRDPKDFSGAILALRFGFKSLGGWVLGIMALRWGIRAPLSATIWMVGCGILWAWLIPGYPFLLAFGLIGAGELAGAYFPNYLLGVSSPAAGAAHLAILNLVVPVSSAAPFLHGLLTDRFGFAASFVLGLTAAGLALWLVRRLPKRGRDEGSP